MKKVTDLKLSRTNANIIAELEKRSISINLKGVWGFLIEGVYKEQKICIAGGKLQSLIHNGSLLPEYFGNNNLFN